MGLDPINPQETDAENRRDQFRSGFKGVLGRDPLMGTEYIDCLLAGSKCPPYEAGKKFADKIGLDFGSVLSETRQIVQRRRYETDVGAAYRAIEEFFHKFDAGRSPPSGGKRRKKTAPLS